jgi:hypothetical protein
MGSCCVNKCITNKIDNHLGRCQPAACNVSDRVKTTEQKLAVEQQSSQNNENFE